MLFLVLGEVPQVPQQECLHCGKRLNIGNDLISNCHKLITGCNPCGFLQLPDNEDNDIERKAPKKTVTFDLFLMPDCHSWEEFLQRCKGGFYAVTGKCTEVRETVKRKSK